MATSVLNSYKQILDQSGGFQHCTARLPECANFWHDFSIIVCWKRAAAETSMTGKWGIRKMLCFTGSFLLYQFHGKFVSPRTKVTALANRRRSITWWWMCENDTPKQNCTPRFFPRGESRRTNHMWQCQSRCLMVCSGTFSHYSDVDNIRTCLGLHSIAVKWWKHECHAPDF